MVRTSIRALEVAAMIFGSLLTLKGELCGSVRGVVVLKETNAPAMTSG